MTITSEQVREKLRRKASIMGSQKALAEDLGVSSAFISDILLGKRQPTGKVLECLGLRRVVRYEPVGPQFGKDK